MPLRPYVCPADEGPQFFYQWIQSIVGRTLHRIGNNIVDTHLPGDDDDIKPPTGFKHKFDSNNEEAPDPANSDEEWIDIEPKDEGPSLSGQSRGTGLGAETTIPDDQPHGRSSGIDAAHAQRWSFGCL